MLSPRRTLAVAVAIAAFAAPPALASPADPTGIFEARGENAGSLVSTGPGIPDARSEHAATGSQAYAIADARGEHAATLASTTPVGSDYRSPDAREPIAAEPAGRPAVDVAPISDGFDWTAAIIGGGAGLALAALAAAAVAVGRRRHVGPSIG